MKKNQNTKEPREFLFKYLTKHSIGAEIGVHLGDFSDLILRNLQPKKLYLIDPWKYEDSEQYSSAWYGGKAEGGQNELDSRYEYVHERFKNMIDTQQVIIYRNQSVEAAKKFKPRYFDWVYIDGNHTYEFVKNDLCSYLPLLKPGGFLCGDDYTECGWWKGGVKTAVDEFIKKKLVEPVLIQDRQYILKKNS